MRPLRSSRYQLPIARTHAIARKNAIARTLPSARTPVPRTAAAICAGLMLTLLAAAFMSLGAYPADASGHRDAPLIAGDPYADGTDVYAFVSPDRTDSVTLVACWVPFEMPEGGPNFYKFGDDVLYELHIDNVGDAKSHLTYQFEFDTAVADPNTFLYNTGAITSLSDPDWNVRQTYTVTELSMGPPVTTKVLGANLVVPPVNIGTKSTPNYEALAMTAVYTASTPAGQVRMFAGPRDDPSFEDLGSVYDLLTLRMQKPPIGYAGKSPGLDGLAGYNVHAIVLQLPISYVTAAPKTILGVWATASRRSVRTIAAGGTVTQLGQFVQVSRMGNPLVNDIVLPLALKDAFNSQAPEQDNALMTSGTPAGNLFQKSVLNPELQNLLNTLYKVPKPSGPRNDLLSIFMTGMKLTKELTVQTPQGAIKLATGTNLNQPDKVQPAEMIRLNTATGFRPGAQGSLCAPKPNNALGLLGGDACGFPNGRRLADDVTDIELVAMAGAGYSVLTTATDFAFSNTLLGTLTDSVGKNDKPFKTSFPYLASPHQGQEHQHSSLARIYMTRVVRTLAKK